MSSLVDKSVKALCFSVIPPLNLCGGGGWFLGGHGDLGRHAFRMSVVQVSLLVTALILMLVLSGRDKKKDASLQLMQMSLGAAIGLLLVLNLLVAVVSFNFAK